MVSRSRQPADRRRYVVTLLDTLMAGRPLLIVTMEVLTMNVTELSAALKRMASETPEIMLEPHADGTLVSDEFDIAVTTSAVQVAEPNCGKAILTLSPGAMSESLRTCQAFINTLQPRRDMLTKLTTMLFAELPDFPNPRTHIDIFRLAKVCNVHVTTVARTIQGKACQTPFGLIPYTQFITNLRK